VQKRYNGIRLVQILQAEVAGQEVETERILADLAQVASKADDYEAKREYLEAVRCCKIIPLKTRETLTVRSFLHAMSSDLGM
jgi:hypothetical protein